MDDQGAEQTQQSWRQEHQTFAYLTMRNNRFARLVKAFFIFVHFIDVLGHFQDDKFSNLQAAHTNLITG